MESNGKTNLLGLTQSELEEFAENIGESSYRGRQLFEWLYTKRVTTFDGMSNLGKTFRSQLARTSIIRGVTLMHQVFSPRDGTTKLLFELQDGMKIESVLIPPATSFRDTGRTQEDEQTRLTLCVSTQVGCALDCKFCATGTMGFFRNLTAGEIVDQVLQVRRLTAKSPTNIVFMGMGEPMLNYDNVMNAAAIMATGIGIALKRITVSTAGRPDRIRQLGDEKRRMKLAVSLHSAVDETRSLLMPINRKFPLDQLLGAIDHYYAQTEQRVTYEYIFFDGINDTDKEIRALIKFARHVPCKINIIPYHSIASTGLNSATDRLRPSRRTDECVKELRAHHLTTLVRSSAGDDIDAACGQLAVRLSRHSKQQALPTS